MAEHIISMLSPCWPLQLVPERNLVHAAQALTSRQQAIWALDILKYIISLRCEVLQDPRISAHLLILPICMTATIRCNLARFAIRPDEEASLGSRGCLSDVCRRSVHGKADAQTVQDTTHQQNGQPWCQ